MFVSDTIIKAVCLVFIAVPVLSFPACVTFVAEERAHGQYNSALRAGQLTMYRMVWIVAVLGLIAFGLTLAAQVALVFTIIYGLIAFLMAIASHAGLSLEADRVSRYS